jgi:hypothetical protein
MCTGDNHSLQFCRISPPAIEFILESRSAAMNANRVRLVCFSVVLFVLSTLPAYASSVRIVRLSLAQGDVQIDRNSGDGWEQAIVNMPVIGGARIYAAEGAKAELEFEDGSSVRLAGPAQISVVELSSSANGAPVNVIQVTSGEVYVNARMHRHDDFRVLAPTGESFAITKPSHLRFTVDQQTASLAMMDGEAVVQANQRRVGSGETYNYILGQPDSAAALNSVPRQPDDSWNQQRDTYNDQYTTAGGQFSGSDDPNAYGNADLGAYGSYSDLPGYGVAWQPYGVGPDWSPFDYGAWSYYPGWGWTFVSGYNWGWAPFFYGDWCYVGGRGWWWRPGSWHSPGHGPGWHPQPRFTGHPSGNWKAPHPPTQATRGTVAVAGSHIATGPIGATHAPGAALGSVRSSAVGAPAGGPIGRVGANSNLVRGRVVAAAPTIVGQKGSYSVSGVSTGRNGYEITRVPASNVSRSASVPRLAAGASRTYGNAGGSSSVPRPSAAPNAPHISGGGFSGGGFHSSGGGGGGGGAHGGGGHR